MIPYHIFQSPCTKWWRWRATSPSSSNWRKGWRVGLQHYPTYQHTNLILIFQGSGCTCWICSWRWRCKYQISLLFVPNSRLDITLISFRMELPLQLMRMTMRPNLWEVVKWSQPLMKVVWNKSTSNVALEELKLVKFSKKAWNFLSKWCSDDDLIITLLQYWKVNWGMFHIQIFSLISKPGFLKPFECCAKVSWVSLLVLICWSMIRWYFSSLVWNFRKNKLMSSTKSK